MRRRLQVAAYWGALLLIVIGSGVLAWSADRVHRVFDLTRAARFTLDASSAAVLDELPGPLQVTVYLPPNDPQRERVADFLGIYTRHKPDFAVTFADPAGRSTIVRSGQVQASEVIFAYREREERAVQLSERDVTNALARLARGGEQWVVFLGGHGERRAARHANHDLSIWAERLEDRGFKVREHLLSTHAAVPANTQVLVIASPTLAYLPGESVFVAEHLGRGGNLLMFNEPDAPATLRAPEDVVGVRRRPGTIIDPLTLARGIDNPAWTMVESYARHRALAGFSVLTVYPYAAALEPVAAPAWKRTVLLPTADKAWTETGELRGNVGLDADEKARGPFTLGVALTRPRPGGEGEQRVIVVGDGDFLSNAYAGNGGNLLLGTRLIEWLSADDTLVDVAVRTTEDNELMLERWQMGVIGFGFLIALPAALALNGALLWWRRRHA